MSLAKSILGSGGIAQIFITDQYYYLLCFKSWDLRFSDEMIEKTTPESGRTREYTTGLSSGVFSINGVSTISNTSTTAAPTYLLQHRNEVHQIQISLTSTDGSTQGISFNALIKESALSNDMTAWEQASFEFQITGDPDLGEIVPSPVAGEIFSDYWNTTPGATSVTGLSVVHGYDLVGITPVGVYREGIEHDLVSGSPGNREARYVDPAVQFDATNPFNAGERVFIIFTE